MVTSDGSTYFAAAGDVRGRIHAMIGIIAEWERRTGNRVSFVLQTGDLEPHRSQADLLTMPAPAGHDAIGDFPDFHSGQAKLPWPVHFIGGSHDPYGYLDTMPDGGELAPNCFYMGRVGCTELAGCCVVGLSGIYSEERFYTERSAPGHDATQSNGDRIYFNEDDIARALDYSTADIVVVHEWPLGIMDPRDAEDLERQRRSLEYDRIGNEYARMLLDLLSPKLLLCGHMHRSYRARIELPTGEFAQVRALADVEQGSDAVAFFRVDAGEGIVEV